MFAYAQLSRKSCLGCACRRWGFPAYVLIEIAKNPRTCKLWQPGGRITPAHDQAGRAPKVPRWPRSAVNRRLFSAVFALNLLRLRRIGCLITA